MFITNVLILLPSNWQQLGWIRNHAMLFEMKKKMEHKSNKLHDKNEYERSYRLPVVSFGLARWHAGWLRGPLVRALCMGPRSWTAYRASFGWAPCFQINCSKLNWLNVIYNDSSCSWDEMLRMPFHSTRPATYHQLLIRSKSSGFCANQDV